MSMLNETTKGLDKYQTSCRREHGNTQSKQEGQQDQLFLAVVSYQISRLTRLWWCRVVIMLVNRETTQARQCLSSGFPICQCQPYSNPTPRLQMYQKSDPQLHFKPNWHLKLHFLVGANDVVVEVTRDNLHSTLSKKKLFPSHGAILCTHHVYNVHATSLLTLPFNPTYTGALSACLETDMK